MKYIYNPIESGAPVSDWIFAKNTYEHPVGIVLHYEDDVAEAILVNYPFLQDLSRSEVEQTLELLKKPFKCEYCKKTFQAQIALTGHLRTHLDEIKDKEDPIDPALVPSAKSQPVNVFNSPVVPQMQHKANPEYDGGLTDDSLDSKLTDMGSFEKKGI
jgi:hypothetical protein